MKLYFRLGAVPELAPLPPHERRVVFDACRRRMRGHWQVWAGAIAGLLLGIAAGLGILYTVVKLDPFDTLVNFFVGGLPLGAFMMAGVELGRTLATINLVGPYARDLVDTPAETPADAETPSKDRQKIEIDYLREPFDDSAPKPGQEDAGTN